MRAQRDKRRNYRGSHIVTNDYAFQTDTWVSGLNNNVLIFGPSGAGKTRNYVKPNILTSHESMIISDTKGALYDEFAPVLKERGFIVENIDFTDLEKGTGYNPLSYIRYNEDKDRYSEQDILALCECLVADGCRDDPFWERAARQYLACIIGYVLEMRDVEEHTLETVIRLLPKMNTNEFDCMMDELAVYKPGNTISMRYDAISCGSLADRMVSSIYGILSGNLDSLVFDEALALYQKPGSIDFASFGKKKQALFLTISDTDRSMDKLANAFMTQALQELTRSADKDYPEHRLDIPVRLYLDDFATNLYIPDFDKTISVIRSREISVSVILQSITQLYSLYGEPAAKTIINNCDHQLYLGGQDADTAQHISMRANKTVENVLELPLNKAYMLKRGSVAVLSEKYDISKMNGDQETVLTGQSPEMTL